MSLTFSQPVYAWLLLLLPLLWWFAAATTSWRQKLLRSVLLSCLVAALMTPVLLLEQPRLTQVYIWDNSDSVIAEQQQQAQALIVQRLTQLNAGDSAVVIQLRPAAVEFSVPTLTLTSSQQHGSSLSRALALALQQIPLGEAGEITLFSDGRATDSHWQAIVAQLQARAVPVHTIALSSQQRAPFIADLSVSAARVNQQVQVEVKLAGDIKLAKVAAMQVALYRQREDDSDPLQADQLLARSDVFTLQRWALPAPLQLSFVAPQAGFLNVVARLESAEDHAAVDDSASSQWQDVIAIQPPLPVLHVSASNNHERLQQLLGPGFLLTSQTPEQFHAAADNAVVLLDDVAASRFTPAAQQQLLEAVRQGTGLFVSGAQQAFADGSFARSELAAALPVQVPPQQTLNQASVALAIVIDSSGSMQGEPLRLAKQMARLAVRQLKPSDQIGVVEFYGARQWAVPMQLAKHAELIERSIGKMQAQGGSTLLPAIEEAYFGLKNVTARYKHLLVISDAGVEEDNYRQLLKHIASDDMTVSTALVGADREGEQRMVDLARWGGGRYYSVGDDFSMVQLDLNAPQLRPHDPYQTGSFSVALHSNAWWSEQPQPPALNGYIKAQPKAAATRLASVAQQPLLSTWQYGAGRVTTLLTSITGEASQSWAAWSDYGNWLATALQHSARQQAPYRVVVQRQWQRMRVDVMATGDSKTAPRLSRIAADNSAGEQVAEIALTQRAPQHWVAVFELANEQALRLRLQHGRWQQLLAQRAAADMRNELQVAAWQGLPLSALAQATQAQYGVLSDVLGAAAPTAQRHSAQRALSVAPWLALLALLLYLLDILYRRWPNGAARDRRRGEGK